MMTPFVRGLLGLGMTLFVVGSTMMVINGIGRGWALTKLNRAPGDQTALAVLTLL